MREAIVKKRANKSVAKEKLPTSLPSSPAIDPLHHSHMYVQRYVIHIDTLLYLTCSVGYA